MSENQKMIHPGHCFLVAEISANHNQSLERALALVRAAKMAGADAVKIQTFMPWTSTIQCDTPPFRLTQGIWAGETLYSLYEKAYMPWEWHVPLVEEARAVGLTIFTTAYDPAALEFTAQFDFPFHKVASFELVDIPLLKKIAATGKPVLVSTGMASLGEIEEAVHALRDNGAGELILLKCTSAYPAQPEEINLCTLPHLAQAFGCLTGLSDHTLGSAVAVAAVTLGACVIEKHFTLSRADGGPDSAFSMEPDEFKRMTDDIRTVEKALGQVSYGLTAKEKESIIFRRSLFVVKAVRAGEPFTPENVRSIRPGHGLHPRYLEHILGRKATCSVSAGTPLSWDLAQ
jgi:pseudaminic acid synthase